MRRADRYDALSIGVIYNKAVSNASYRALWPAMALAEQRGHRLELAEQSTTDSSLRYENLLSCDVVHVFRTADRVVAKAVDDLRRRGVAITWDNDDDVRLAPKESKNYREVGGLAGQRMFRLEVNMMRRAQLVTTSTEHLAERFRAEHEVPVQVVPNYLHALQFARGRDKHEGVVIGWVAGREHAADAQRLNITAMLRAVMERDPNVRVVTMGLRLDLDRSRYEHHEFIPFGELGAAIRGFDIGIAPLADIPMSYARSDVKVKEYSAAGVPWVASARGPYAGLDDRSGGVLADDDRWAEALLELAGSRLKRARLQRRAEKWARSQQIDRNVDRWEAVWRSAIEAADRVSV
jgi:glycosyltransferase involved in cell wall biosynthesis